MPEKEQPKARRPNLPHVPKPVPPWATMAIKALAAGTADANQQQRALAWIINDLCGTYDWPYRPGMDQSETHIALGKQWVGQRIVTEVNISMTKITQGDTENG